MTYQEYVTVVLGKFGLSTSDIEFLLTEAGLNPNTTVTTSDEKVLLKTAMYNHLPLLMAGLQDVTEGGYSIKWNLAGLNRWYSLLSTELGLDDLLNIEPTVTDASNRW